MKNNKPLKAWVKQNEAKLTLRDYNTNNAWGFGGSYGTEYLLPDGKTFVRIGTACTRHCGTSYIEMAGRKPEFECRDHVYTRFTVAEFFELRRHRLDNPPPAPVVSMTCNDCGTVEGVEDTFCPYDQEISGIDTPVRLCGPCVQKRANDI